MPYCLKLFKNKEFKTMLKPAKQSDFDYIYGLYMHPEVNPFLLYELMSKQDFEPIFIDLLNDKVLYIFENEGTNVGMCKLVRLKHRTAHIAYLGGVAIDPAFGGKGLGKKMFHQIIDLGKSLGLLRIELSTATHNERAIGLYESIGFEKEGVLRRYTHLKSEGQFIDEVLMSYLYR
jgi:L-phenylalanine/L-methionine N-acetyltransferase